MSSEDENSMLEEEGEFEMSNDDILMEEEGEQEISDLEG